MDQEPTIGRIVHYVANERKDKHLPAIVVKVWENNVCNLQVFTNEVPSIKWKLSVSHDEGLREMGTWHWPERVQ